MNKTNDWGEYELQVAVQVRRSPKRAEESVVVIGSVLEPSMRAMCGDIANAEKELFESIGFDITNPPKNVQFTAYAATLVEPEKALDALEALGIRNAQEVLVPAPAQHLRVVEVCDGMISLTIRPTPVVSWFVYWLQAIWTATVILFVAIWRGIKRPFRSPAPPRFP